MIFYEICPPPLPTPINQKKHEIDSMELLEIETSHIGFFGGIQGLQPQPFKVNVFFFFFSLFMKRWGEKENYLIPCPHLVEHCQ